MVDPYVLRSVHRGDVSGLFCPRSRSARGVRLHTAHTLRERKVLVRHFDTPRLADSLRITVGTKQDNDVR